MPDVPERPSDPRDEPYYIDNECHQCGSELVLWDEYYDTEGDTWWDEWVCPECENGVYMDWPESEYDKLQDRIEDEFNA